MKPIYPGDQLVQAYKPARCAPPPATLTGNIRTANPDGYKELNESIEASGWLPEFPAIYDESGVCVVGNRREAVAAELGIDQILKVIEFGDPAGVAHRYQLAIASNVGATALLVSGRVRSHVLPKTTYKLLTMLGKRVPAGDEDDTAGVYHPLRPWDLMLGQPGD